MPVRVVATRKTTRGVIIARHARGRERVWRTRKNTVVYLFYKDR